MDYIDSLIARAEALVCFMTQDEAAGVLMESGVTAGDAYLAVKAACCGR